MNEYVWGITREDDVILVSISDKTGYPLEFLKLAAGHPAFGWTDDEVKEYLVKKLELNHQP